MYANHGSFCKEIISSSLTRQQFKSIHTKISCKRNGICLIPIAFHIKRIIRCVDHLFHKIIRSSSVREMLPDCHVCLLRHGVNTKVPDCSRYTTGSYGCFPARFRPPPSQSHLPSINSADTFRFLSGNTIRSDSLHDNISEIPE